MTPDHRDDMTELDSDLQHLDWTVISLHAREAVATVLKADNRGVSQSDLVWLAVRNAMDADKRARETAERHANGDYSVELRDARLVLENMESVLDDGDGSYLAGVIQSLSTVATDLVNAETAGWDDTDRLPSKIKGAAGVLSELAQAITDRVNELHKAADALPVPGTEKK